jgi:hypothetical protein
MAKRGPRNLRRISPGADVSDARERITNRGVRRSTRMVDFAEDLGRLLGTAQAKASNWLNQRKNVIDELTQLRDTANHLLSELTGESVSAAVRGVRRGRRSALANGGATGATKSTGGRRPMSAAARRAVSIRMRKYWAQRRREKAAKA